MENNLNSSLETLFSKMDEFVSTKTVVGEPINMGGVIMLPLVDVFFGVGAGASAQAEDSKKSTDAGGLGAKITPSAVIVIQDGSVQLVNVKNQDAVSKLIDMAPGIVNKLNLSAGKKEKDHYEDDGDFEERIVEEVIIRDIEE